MTKAGFILCIAIPTLWSTTSLAHGVSHTVFEGAFGIEVRYDDRTPMQHSEVKVFSPLDTETEFQQGFTDKNGRFTFFPESTGTWRVVVDDGMGHAASENIEIKEVMKLVGYDSPRFSRCQGLVIGVSVIFGIFGIIAFFLARRASVSAKDK